MRLAVSILLASLLAAAPALADTWVHTRDNASCMPMCFNKDSVTKKADGLTYDAVAARLTEQFGEPLTRHAVAAMLRRAREATTAEPRPGLSPTTVRYVHTIVHAALDDAVKCNRVDRNPADAATPPLIAAFEWLRCDWVAEQLL